MASNSQTSLILSSATTGVVNSLLSFRVLKSLLTLLNAVLILLLFPFRMRWRNGVSVDQKLLKEEKLDIGSSQQRKAGPVVLRVSAGIVSRKNNPTLDKQLIGPGGQGVPTRRALAIRRVTMDGGGGSIRKYFLFSTSRGYTLFTQSWSPVSVQVRTAVRKDPKHAAASSHVGGNGKLIYMTIAPRVWPFWGIIILLHGLNEHSGRYDTFAKQLNAVGFKVYAMDWIGHGGSDGLHAYVHSLDDAVEDTKDFLCKVVADNPEFPCFFYGHSTGAAIVLKVVLDPKANDLVAGIVLTSPVIRVEPGHPVLALLAPVLSSLLPKYQFDSANKPESIVSRDPEALIEKYTDPLVFTGSIRVRTAAEILRICNCLQQNLRMVTTPFLVLHGTADTLTEPEGSQKLYEEASSADKSIKLYDGLLHDLLFEPEKKAIEKDIIDWLSSKLET